MRRSHSLPGGRVALPGLILLAAACASIRLAPMRADDEPFVPETNERELWLEADRFERRIVASGALNEDAPLEAYLNSVVARLAAGRVDSSDVSFRVRVLEDPSLNAVAETAAGVPGIGLAGLAAEVVFFNDDLQAPPRHSH